MKHRLSRPLMNEAAGGDAGGAQGGAVDPAIAAPATPAAPAASVLAQAAAPNPADRFPEKYRVMKEDGTLDSDASTTKLSEGYSHLAKRLGSGDAPPAAPTDYKVNVPEALADSLKEWDQAGDEKLQAFLTDAHKAGFTQAQVDTVMGKYFDMMPALTGAAQVKTPEQQATEATADLRKVWATDQDFQTNVGHAYRASVEFSAKVGLTFEDIEAAGLSNNPTFMRLMAAIGPELGEDKPVNEGGQQGGGDWQSQVNDLKAQKAALPEKDPRRADIQKRISDMYERKYPTAKP